MAATTLTLLLAACGGDEGGGTSTDRRAAPPAAAGSAAPKPGAVQIKTFIFNPDPITVKTGEKVIFTNLDSTTHTVTAGTRNQPDKGTFDAGLDEGQKFEHTFDEPGEYDYFCDLHSGDGMVGKVIVQ